MTVVYSTQSPEQLLGSQDWRPFLPLIEFCGISRSPQSFLRQQRRERRIHPIESPGIAIAECQSNHLSVILDLALFGNQQDYDNMQLDR